MSQDDRRAIQVGAARPEELPAAFRLAFRHLDAEGRDLRADHALELVRSGELDRAGVCVARGDEGLLGAMIGTPIAGAGGLVWPPQALPGAARAEVEDRLVGHVTAWLRERGAKLAQALLVPEEAPLAAPLQRNGFAHVTHLWYLRHDLQGLDRLLPAAERLEYRAWDAAGPDLFGQTLLRTYEQTQDCPEVNGVRTLAEVIAGHQAQGAGGPAAWWLALRAGRPAGVLLLARTPDRRGWDVSYVGVVPECRRQGLGRELMGKALLEARVAGADQLTLSVDARNRPALELYRRAGFLPYDRREVYLAVWG